MAGAISVCFISHYGEISCFQLKNPPVSGRGKWEGQEPFQLLGGEGLASVFPSFFLMPIFSNPASLLFLRSPRPCPRRGHSCPTFPPWLPGACSPSLLWICPLTQSEPHSQPPTLSDLGLLRLAGDPSQEMTWCDKVAAATETGLEPGDLGDEQSRNVTGSHVHVQPW